MCKRITQRTYLKLQLLSAEFPAKKLSNSFLFDVLRYLKLFHFVQLLKEKVFYFHLQWNRILKLLTTKLINRTINEGSLLGDILEHNNFNLFRKHALKLACRKTSGIRQDLFCILPTLP